MPKIYYCDKALNGINCGETDPSKFETGRYNTCKRCRNKRNTEYHKVKKEEEIKSEEDKIDPDFKIRKMVEEIVLHKPFFGRSLSIKQKIDDIDGDITDVLTSCMNKIEKLELEIKMFKEKVNN